MDVRFGPWRRLCTEELMSLNCGVWEDPWESLGPKDLLGEIQPAYPKGNRHWIFNGRTDAEAETPILWPPGARSWLIGKDPDAGIDWRQTEKRETEDEIASLTQWTAIWANWETVKDREAWCAPVHGVPKSWTPLSDWTAKEVGYFPCIYFLFKHFLLDVSVQMFYLFGESSFSFPFWCREILFVSVKWVACQF